MSGADVDRTPRPYWVVRQLTAGYASDQAETAGELFHREIGSMWNLGYELDSWRMATTSVVGLRPDGHAVTRIIDTIVAVFRRRAGAGAEELEAVELAPGLPDGVCRMR